MKGVFNILADNNGYPGDSDFGQRQSGQRGCLKDVRGSKRFIDGEHNDSSQVTHKDNKVLSLILLVIIISI